MGKSTCSFKEIMLFFQAMLFLPTPNIIIIIIINKIVHHPSSEDRRAVHNIKIQNENPKYKVQTNTLLSQTPSYQPGLGVLYDLSTDIYNCSSGQSLFYTVGHYVSQGLLQGVVMCTIGSFSALHVIGNISCRFSLAFHEILR